MRYEVKDREILISIPASNDGKYRFKTRENNLKYGESFATRTNKFTDDVYLEWQIGYDATELEVKKGEKKTTLMRLMFIGANGKRKHPYELSELINEAIKIGLISRAQIKSLLNEIVKYKKDYIDQTKIAVAPCSKRDMHGVPFEETSIKLPTYFMVKTDDNTQIEVSIQKQQYATGVQPMVYLCIPIKSFNNYRDIMGRPSEEGDELIYIINRKNVSTLIYIIKIFAMCSADHNHDISEILTLLIKTSK